MSINYPFAANIVCVSNAVNVGLFVSKNVFLERLESYVQPAVLYNKNVIVLFLKQLK